MLGNFFGADHALNFVVSNWLINFAMGFSAVFGSLKAIGETKKTKKAFEDEYGGMSLL